MTAASRRFPLFDSLRAIAALSIVVYHVLTLTPVLDGLHLRSLERWAVHLDVGVNIFFVISGFLLYRPFARARLEGERPPSVGPYAWRRALRIVPAYWVALTVSAIVLPLSGVVGPGGLRFYGFAQIYDPDTLRSGIPQAWSLCVEIAFYAFIPALALALARVPPRTPRRWLRSELLALVAVGAVSVAYKLWAIGRVEVDTTAAGPLLFPLPNFLDQFAIGMGLAVASIAVEAGLVSTRAVALLRRRSSLSWLAALALFAIAGAMTGGTGLGGAAANESEVLLRHGLHGLIALAVVLPAVTTTGPQGSAQRMLALRTLQWLGLISYSIYLWHGLIELEVIKRIGQPEGFAASAGTLLLVCGATIAVAAVSFYAIERPALGLRRLVPDRGRAQRGARAPAAEAAAARVELARSEP